MKKLLTILTALIVVSCQPAMADQKYILKHAIPMCKYEFALRSYEYNAERGLSMSNEELTESGICKIILKPSEVELAKWPVEGDFLTVVNLRLDGIVYFARKYSLELVLVDITEDTSK